MPETDINSPINTNRGTTPNIYPEMLSAAARARSLLAIVQLPLINHTPKKESRVSAMATCIPA